MKDRISVGSGDTIGAALGICKTRFIEISKRFIAMITQPRYKGISYAKIAEIICSEMSLNANEVLILGMIIGTHIENDMNFSMMQELQKNIESLYDDSENSFPDMMGNVPVAKTTGLA